VPPGVGRQLTAAAGPRNGLGRDVSNLTELVGAAAATAQSASLQLRWNTFQTETDGVAMNTERHDPESELTTREPLRIVFALAALLLGLIAAMH
jgi:hypothetical protein